MNRQYLILLEDAVGRPTYALEDSFDAVLKFLAQRVVLDKTLAQKRASEVQVFSVEPVPLNKAQLLERINRLRQLQSYQRDSGQLVQLIKTGQLDDVSLENLRLEMCQVDPFGDYGAPWPYAREPEPLTESTD